MFPDINRVFQITQPVEQKDKKEPQLQFGLNLVDFSEFRVQRKATKQRRSKKEAALLHNIWRPENTGM